MAKERRETQNPRLETGVPLRGGNAWVTIAQALREVKRLAVDASALIDYIEETPETIALLRRLLEKARTNRIALVGSSLLYAEMLVVARTDTHYTDAEARYRAALEEIEIVPITKQASERAADFRMDYRLETADALHLSCAVESKCDAFVTCDGHFNRAQGIPVGPGGQSLKIIHTRKLRA